MLDIIPTAPVRGAPSPQPGSGFGFDLDLGTLLVMLRRRWRWLLGAVLACMGVALWYLSVTAPVFTASASVMIDTRRPSMFQQTGQTANDPLTDVTLVETQLETLRSRRIAEVVVRNLHLDRDQELGASPPPAQGWLSRLLFPARDQNRPADQNGGVDPAVRDATDALMRNVSVRRAGSSYIIEIEARSKDPAKAAQIANEVVDAYIGDQLAFQSELLQREVFWLEGRIDALRERADAADRAVQDFKVANNILDANGRLLTDQQLADVSSQLAAARADTAQMKARLDRAEAIVKSGQIDESVTDVLKNEVITKLRQQWNEASRREGEWTARYGADHPAAVNLRSEMASLQRGIQQEFTRIVETYRSEYEIAKTREASLERSLADQFKKTAEVRQAQVKLRGYESTSETYRALYDSFLQKYLQTVNQQTSPVTSARVIASASPPSRKSWPKTSLVLAGALSAGTLLGFALVLGVEMLDRRIRTTGQVEQITGVRCVGSLPIALGSRSAGPPVPAAKPVARVPARNPREFELPPRSPVSYAVHYPFSQFAEVIRALKVAVDREQTVGTKVVGIVSTFPNEGKSTVAGNFAGLVAHSGARVLLIDADLRNSDLTRTLVPDARDGLLDVLEGKRPMAEVIRVERTTGLHFVPGSAARRSPHTSESLAGAGMGQLFEAMRAKYDYIVLDLSPFGLIVDAQAVSHVVSEFVLVVGWGEPSTSQLSRALANAPAIHEKLAAAVLNKVNVSQFMAYDSDAGVYHSSQYWSKYVDASGTHGT